MTLITKNIKKKIIKKYEISKNKMNEKIYE